MFVLQKLLLIGSIYREKRGNKDGLEWEKGEVKMD